MFTNEAVERCSHCGTPIDRGQAKAAAAVQEKVNRTVDLASYARILAGAMPVLYLGSFLPIVGFAAGWGFLFLVFVVPIFVFRSWVSTRAIPKNDPALKKARRNLIETLGIWLLMFLIFLALRAVTQ